MQMARQRKGTVRWKNEEIAIRREAIALLAKGTKEDQIIIDSGTTLHMHRDQEAFQSISNVKVNIRGVAGVGVGYKGLLKPNKIGAKVPAVWCADLPVRMLVSTEGLRRGCMGDAFLSERRHDH